jgi:hypothetical protein
MLIKPFVDVYTFSIDLKQLLCLGIILPGLILAVFMAEMLQSVQDAIS